MFYQIGYTLFIILLAFFILRYGLNLVLLPLYLFFLVLTEIEQFHVRRAKQRGDEAWLRAYYKNRVPAFDGKLWKRY